MTVKSNFAIKTTQLNAALIDEGNAKSESCSSLDETAGAYNNAVVQYSTLFMTQGKTF